MIAYLVAFVRVSPDLGAPHVVGVGIYSEPAPTTGSNIFTFMIDQEGNEWDSYEEAEEKLCTRLAGLPSWHPLTKLVRWSSDRQPLKRLAFKLDRVGEYVEMHRRVCELQAEMSPDELVLADMELEQPEPRPSPRPGIALPKDVERGFPMKPDSQLPAVWVTCPTCYGALGDGADRCPTCRGSGVVVNATVRGLVGDPQ